MVKVEAPPASISYGRENHFYFAIVMDAGRVSCDGFAVRGKRKKAREWRSLLLYTGECLKRHCKQNMRPCFFVVVVHAPFPPGVAQN